MHPNAWLLVLPALSIVAAQSTVTNLVLPGIFEKSIVGSVVSAAPDATTYILTCPVDVPSGRCVLEGGVTFTESPSTVHWRQVYGDLDTTTEIQVDCTFSGEDAYFTLRSTWATTVAVTSGIQPTYKRLQTPVTLTAGLEWLSPGAAASEAAAKASTTLTGAGTTATSGSGTGPAAATRSSTAGESRVTQNVVVAGVAAVLGGALII